VPLLDTIVVEDKRRFKNSAAWPRGLKCRFYGDRVITIA